MTAIRLPLGGLKSAIEAPTQGVPDLRTLLIAWAAGFFDGEGCISIVRQKYSGKRKPSLVLRVHIAQNHLPTLEAFRAATGVMVPIYESPRAPNHRRQCYQANYSSGVAVRLLTALLPYLRRKRLEAAAALRFWTRGQYGVRRGGRGLDPAIAAIREHYRRLLQRLK